MSWAAIEVFEILLNTIMKLISYVPSFIRNKYLFALTAFVVWMLFFDKNDVFTQWQRKKELKTLQESKAYFTEEIVHEKKVSEELRSNPAVIEKYAREKYLMKRDNEDVFIIQDEGKTTAQ